MKAAIVFDMDGVLADTERLKFRAHRAAVEATGGALDPEGYRQEMGKAHVGVIQAFLSASGLDASDSAVKRYEERFKRAYRELLADELRPMPGAREVLAASRNEVRPLALVTSSEGWMAEIVLGEILEGITPDRIVEETSSGVVDGIPNGVVHGIGEGILSGLGARDVFEAVVTADDVEREKPDPEPYLRAREALGFRGDPGDRDPGEGVAVEDTPAGVASASAAGLPVIAVRHDFNRHHAFEGASAILDSLDPPERFLKLVDEVAYERARP